MADKLENTNHRHQDENDEEPEQKRQKRNECENPANTLETKKITNIYYDCLERIFDFLHLESLLMVAQTCKRLQIAAAAKFGDEFGKKRIRLYSDPRGSEPGIIVLQKEIRVFGLKLCLAFLRCFGAKISDLFVVGKQKVVVDQYINEYCADTLTSIEFQYRRHISIEAFKKPFKNVEKARFETCYLEHQLTDIVNWFPNLRRLEIPRSMFYDSAMMNLSFTHLEHLEISVAHEFRNETAVKLLQANPQLQKVTIETAPVFKLTKILGALSANSLITKLEVTRILDYAFKKWDTSLNANELNRFVAAHPLVEELILKYYHVTAVDAINFIRQMESLKRIGFLVKDRPECDRITLEFNDEWKSEVKTAIFGRLYVELSR